MTQWPIDLEHLREHATQRQDDYEVLMYLLQDSDRIQDDALDAWVQTVAEPIIQAIDCTQCANCCQNLEVYLTQADTQRIAERVDIPLASLWDYEAGQAQGEWALFTQRPCQFLCEKRCTIYADRPEACRIYPVFTPDFRWTLQEMIPGASICPIIFHVLNIIQRIDAHEYEV